AGTRPGSAGPDPSRPTTAGTGAARTPAPAAACGPRPGQRCWGCARCSRSTWLTSGSVAVEDARLAGTVAAQRALGTGRVRPGEPPVLRGGRRAEVLGVRRSRAGDPQVRLHPGRRVGAGGAPFLARVGVLVAPVQVVGCERDRARVRGSPRLDRAPGLLF